MDRKPVKPQPMAASDSVDSYRTRRRRAHSFSSSLLESICQSMDEDEHHSSRRSQHIGDAQSNNKFVRTHSHISHHQPPHINVSKQNRTKTSASYAEIVVLQAGQVTKSEKPIHRVHAPSFSSSSVVSNFSYSDSSSTHGPLSSSVSSYGPGSGDSSSSSCFSTCSGKSPKSSIKEKITKVKLRAIKLYTELKTPKNNKPTSPRCPFATYLNSLFTPRKQNKTEQLVVTPPQKTYTKPNKTSITKLKPLPPPASGSGGAMYNDQDAPVSMKMMRRDHHDQAKGREIFKKCQEKIVRGLKMREFVEELSDDGDNDAESYASSDLFELEFLMERGGVELPVFETTDIKINQAIANGFSL